MKKLIVTSLFVLCFCVPLLVRAGGPVPSGGGGKVKYQVTDCFAITGNLGEQCVDTDTGALYTCSFPAQGGTATICDVAGDWLLNSSSSTSGVSTFNTRAGVVVPATGDYTATQVTNTPAGNIAATTTQAALNELDTEKQPLDADLTTLAGKTIAGTGSDVRLSTGSFATNDCVKVDASGNLATAGAACGSGGGGGLSGLTANQVMFATGASSIGGSSLFTFDGTVSPNMRITPSASNRVALQLMELGTTSGPSIGGYPPLLSLGTVDGGSYYALGYSTGSGGTLRQWANWLDDATGNLTYDSIASNGSLLGRVSLTADGSLMPTGLTASQLVATDSNKKLVSTTAPTISSFANATHTHTNSAGGGQLAEGALSLTDITTNNATTSLHGLLPKLGGGTTNFLRADGAWAAPSGGSLTLQQAFTNGKVITGATSEANAVDVGNGTGGIKFWTESGVTHAKVYPDQASINTIADTFTWVLEQSDGTDLLVVDETTGAITAAAAASIDFSAVSASKPCRTAAGASPTVSGQCAYDSTSNTVEFGVNGSNKTVAFTDTVLALAGGTLTGQGVASNLGWEFTESDTNPTCAAGNYTIYADNSEAKLKKCTNGTVSDLDTTGSGTTPQCGAIDCVAPVYSNFTWLGSQGAATFDNSHTGSLRIRAVPDATDQIFGLHKAAPSTPYTFAVQFDANLASETNYCGILFDDGTKIEIASFLWQSLTYKFAISDYTNRTTFSAGAITAISNPPYSARGRVFLRGGDDGTNRTVEVSNDGETYEKIFSVARTTFLTVTNIGFGCSSASATTGASMRVYHWQ